MRILLIGCLAVACCLSQVMVDPAKIPPKFRAFELVKDEQPLQCEVAPIKPRIDFGFRFQAGYAVRVPLEQYFGKGHTWGILSRVTPEGGQPSYLVNAIRLPDIPKTKVNAEVGGMFLLGEGRYTADLLLADDQNRICRKQWKIDVKRSRSERKMTLRLPPGTVRALGSRHEVGHERPGERPYRLTVLVHAAPVFPRSTRLRFFDREMLLGTLGPLLEQLPAASVRLVVFNLDQQKKVLSRDVFRPEELDQVGQALNGLELSTVNYTVLQNQGGHVSLLADLINKELDAQERADAVVFLGPATRYFDRFPESALTERSAGEPRFFYLQYRPFFARGSEFPDLIQHAVKSLHGKSIVIHSPGEFANALRQIETRLREK